MEDAQSELQTESQEPAFAVIDIPVSATAEQTAALLNECGTAFYVSTAVEWPEASARRVILRRPIKAAPKPQKLTAAEATAAALEPKEQQTPEERAIQFIDGHLKESNKTLAVAVEAILGHPRTWQWVAQRRDEILRARAIARAAKL